MPDRVRVYHPETLEAFDLPVDKAAELRLNQGWLSSLPDKQAEPYIQTVDRGIVTSSECTLEEDWRDTEVGQEVMEAAPVRPPRRKRQN